MKGIEKKEKIIEQYLIPIIEKIFKRLFLSAIVIFSGLIPLYSGIFPAPMIRSISLDQAIAFAQKNSPLLNQPLSSLNKSRLLLDAARAQNAPLIALSGRYFNDILNTGQSRWVPNIDIQYDLLSFIKNKYNIYYYEKLADVSAINLEQKKTILTILLYQEYLNYNFLFDLIREARVSGDYLKRDLDILRIQSQYDLIPRSLLNEWLAMSDRSEETLRLAEQNILGLIDRINYLMGLEEFVFPRRESMDVSKIAEINQRDYIAELGQQKLAALRLVLRGAKMPLLPSVQIATYSVLPVNQELNFFSGFWVAVSVSYPLFNRGERRRNEALAMNDLKTAEMEFERVKRKREMDVSQARQNIENLSGRSRSLGREIDALEKIIKEYALNSDDNLFFDDKRERLYLDYEEKKMARIKVSHEICLAQLDYLTKKSIAFDDLSIDK